MCLTIRARHHPGGMFLVLVLATSFILTSCSWYDDTVLDNKDQALPCDQLPSEQEVAQGLADHQDVVQRILAVNPGQVFVEVDTLTCPSHASIVISYPARKDRVAIEKIIGSDAFFGVPYRLHNQ